MDDIGVEARGCQFTLDLWSPVAHRDRLQAGSTIPKALSSCGKWVLHRPILCGDQATLSITTTSSRVVRPREILHLLGWPLIYLKMGWPRLPPSHNPSTSPRHMTDSQVQLYALVWWAQRSRTDPYVYLVYKWVFLSWWVNSRPINLHSYMLSLACWTYLVLRVVNTNQYIWVSIWNPVWNVCGPIGCNTLRG